MRKNIFVDAQNHTLTILCVYMKKGKKNYIYSYVDSYVDSYIDSYMDSYIDSYIYDTLYALKQFL